MGAIVLFSDEFADHAAVYLHGDDGDVPDQLEEFFAQEDALMGKLAGATYSNRFDDPQYLAARFVAFAITPSGSGVGVTVPSERSDANYRVLCTQKTWPQVATL